MPQALIYILAAVVLFLPIAGAVALRLLRTRMTNRPWYLLAIVVFGAVFASALALARGAGDSVQVGGLTILQPYQQNTDISSELVPTTEVVTPDLPVATPLPADATTVAPPLSPTEPVVQPTAPTAIVSATAELPTATPEPPTVTPEPPTATPEPPTATPEPPTATPEPPTVTPEPPTVTPAPQAQQRYTVQPGDTLRSIAEKFGVTVQALLRANDLTPEQADSLRPGQELIIPAP